MMAELFSLPQVGSRPRFRIGGSSGRHRPSAQHPFPRPRASYLAAQAAMRGPLNNGSVGVGRGTLAEDPGRYRKDRNDVIRQISEVKGGGQPA